MENRTQPPEGISAKIQGRFSSASNDWATPDDIFAPLAREFDFVLDCAAAKWNHRTPDYLTKEEDALTVDWCARATAVAKSDTLDQTWDGYRGPAARMWHPTVAAWLNPPYGRAKDAKGKGRGPVLLDLFVRKAYAESQKGLTVVVLCFARPDTDLWDRCIMKAAEVRFIRSRVKFVREDGTTGPAPAPSCIVIFKPGHKGAPDFSVWHRQYCTCKTCKEVKRWPTKTPTPSMEDPAFPLGCSRRIPSY